MNHLRITCAEKEILADSAFRFEFDAIYSEYGKLNQQQFYAVKDQNIVIINKQRVDERVIANNPQLRLIAVCSTGFEHINLPLLRKNGIQACNVRGYAGDTVAEHAFLLMMNLVKNFAAQYEAVKSGEWSASARSCFVAAPIQELKGKHLAIIGMGETGRALAGKAQAFGMKVSFSERKHAHACRPGYIPFEQAISQADILSLNCELNQDTHRLIDASVLSRMKSGSFLVNVGRGGLIDEDDVVQALQEGRIGGFATDVLNQEPPVKTHPFLMLKNMNVIVTAHIAWATQEARNRMFEVLNRNINAFVAGEPQNLIT
ncbi:MAG TPA: hydroxyacid dehydrogenase [Advenella kashmirensis]|uniref:Hydroxyacid dehydrogenase n=1 Tax=Advenella kashmirensis TaxID=310575 RepID=A0A356LJ52_9BURK|nr:hydroxyacid dehydrogenase [Advenella kashmirensis]